MTPSQEAVLAVDAMIAEAVESAKRVVEYANADTPDLRRAKALLMLHDPQMRGPVEAHERERIERERAEAFNSLRPGEFKALSLGYRCTKCGHLAVLHSYAGATEDCNVEGCGCTDGSYA